MEICKRFMRLYKDYLLIGDNQKEFINSLNIRYNSIIKTTVHNSVLYENVNYKMFITIQKGNKYLKVEKKKRGSSSTFTYKLEEINPILILNNIRQIEKRLKKVF